VHKVLKADLLPIRIAELRYSAYWRNWIKLGHGYVARARHIDGGFEIRIWNSTKSFVAKSRIETKEMAYKNGRTQPKMVCGGCKRPRTGVLYLSDDFFWRCSECLHLDRHYYRKPISYNYDKDRRFRKLLKHIFDREIINAEVELLRNSKHLPEAFFNEHPYLVPEFVSMFRDVDDRIYKKLLKALHSKYLDAMRKRSIKGLTVDQHAWFDKEFQSRVETGYRITRRDNEWLQKLRSQQLQQESKVIQTGPLDGTQLVEYDSQPLVTESSSSKTSSSPAMTANLVTEPGTSTEQEL
jgi:hypothetical protein